MERVMCDSPSKNTFINEYINCPKSPASHTTPIRQNDKNQRENGFTNGIPGLNLLPAHITPPSGLTKFMARNPFDADLTSRLHLSVISPTVFTKVSPTPRRDSPGFSWSVDELALIQPAKIEEFPLQQMHTTDPDIEIVAQAAINKFFTANQIIPSPWDGEKKAAVAKSELHTPTRPLEDLNTTREAHKNKRECWTQTVLTLPPVLPVQLEEALKPYFTFNQDQNVENEDANSSNNSLRRKLFFNHDDCTDDEEDTSLSLSPTKQNGSMILPSSPPRSGMFVHGTPLRGRSFGLQRTHGTPCAGSLSPPNMSPISSHDMSCQSIRSRCQFAARLDFTTDMSIDTSVRDDKELKRIEDIDLETNTSVLRSNLLNDGPETHGKNQSIPANEEVEIQNKTAEMLSRETTPLKGEKISPGITTISKNKEIFGCLKISRESSYINIHESYAQNNTILGNSCTGQQSDVNSGQDTGYQTYSMSNITGNTDNCSIITPITKSFNNWNEKISTHGDEIKLSDWPDNMKIMFSSTPSKYSRRKDV